MKKINLTFLILLFVTSSLFSQTEFLKGYYITDEGHRIEGLIKNDNWKNNPTMFSFKKNDTDSPSKKLIDNVTSFEIYDICKFEKNIVNIDKASSKVNDLSTIRQPNFVEEKLFLKVLVEGDASLYLYEETNLIRYFYKTQKEPLQQLVYKKYRTSTDQIAENVTYQYQLKTNLKCENNKLNSTESLKYNTKYLVNFFNSYNLCSDPDYNVVDLKSNNNTINISLRPGVRIVSFETENSINNQRNIPKSTGVGFRIGVEIETILPFNNNKWGLFVEPTYQSYNKINNEDDIETGIEYNALEFAFGGRHYLFINDKTKLFVNAGYNLNIPLGDSFLQFSETTQTDIEDTIGNITLGAGIKWNDKFSGELRFHTSRDIQSQFISSTTNYNVVEFIVGYTIF